MKRNKIKIAIRRIFRILILKKGVYCKYGQGNKFDRAVYLTEKTRIGSYNYIGPGVMSLNARIGNYCSIGPHVKLGQMEHDLHCVSTSTRIFGKKHGVTDFSGYIEPTVIENDVWLAANVVVKQGVVIRTGAVVAAGAVVTKDVPPYAVVGGVPARIIKFRFNEEERDMLLASNWWDKAPSEAVNICKELQNRINSNENSAY